MKKCQVKCECGKETIHFKVDSSTSELLMRTSLAVNQLTFYHAVSLEYNRVHDMHQGEPDVDVKLYLSMMLTTWLATSLKDHCEMVQKGKRLKTR